MTTTTEQYIPFNAVQALLERIDQDRQQLAQHKALLQTWLDSSSELRDLMTVFNNVGGVGAADFADLIEGRFKCRSHRVRKHLRLIAVNDEVRSGDGGGGGGGGGDDDGNDAAA